MPTVRVLRLNTPANVAGRDVQDGLNLTEDKKKESWKETSGILMEKEKTNACACEKVFLDNCAF